MGSPLQNGQADYNYNISLLKCQIFLPLSPPLLLLFVLILRWVSHEVPNSLFFCGHISHNDYIFLEIIGFIGKSFVSFYFLCFHQSSWVSFYLLPPSKTFLHVSTHLFSSTACIFLLIFFLTHLMINLRFFCLALLH